MKKASRCLRGLGAAGILPAAAGGLFLMAVWMLGDAAVLAAHPSFWLKNEQGDRIAPGRNDADPYSPRKTCGGCHPYAAITTGYHFQQGFDQMRDGYDPKRRGVLSPGMFGKWLPPEGAGLLAAKKNRAARDIDLSTYDWIGTCGTCHPGGGPLEYGRNAAGRADRSRTHVEAEALAPPHDGDYSASASPDGRSRFRASGVVEADCLLCHLPGYRFGDRTAQLARRNYRWAATAGAGLGTVSGAIVRDGVWNLDRRPVTAYAWKNARLFDASGRFRGSALRKAVGSANCLFCHGEGALRGSGVRHGAASDVHARAGLVCTDCHGLVGKGAERLTHQIAKGRSPVLSVRDDLDGKGMKSCGACHVRGAYAPPRPGMPPAAKNPKARHAERFAGVTFHTALVRCNACHITALDGRATLLLDMSAGREEIYTADAYEGLRGTADAARPTATPWAPWMMRDERRYGAAVPKTLQWFGERKAGGVQPIPLREVRRAAQGLALTNVAVRLPDGATVRRSTVATDAQIAAMLQRLAAAGYRRPVLVADAVYALEKGKVTASPLTPDLLTTLFYSVDHHVPPVAAGRTYGARGRPEGCGDCHRDGAAFFGKMAITNPRGFLREQYPVPADPHAQPLYMIWGLKGIPDAE